MSLLMPRDTDIDKKADLVFAVSGTVIGGFAAAVAACGVYLQRKNYKQEKEDKATEERRKIMMRPWRWLRS